jgi:hypothetical protein
MKTARTLEIGWFAIHELPQNLIMTTKNAIAAYSRCMNTLPSTT